MSLPKKQKQNIPKTKSNIEKFNSDMSISIDDFIADLLVSDPESCNNLSSYSTETMANETNQTFAVENLDDADDVWDNFQTSVNGLNSGGIMGAENVMNRECSDEFTSFSSFVFSNSINKSVKCGLTQPNIPNNLGKESASRNEQFETISAPNTGTISEDGFEDFQGCTLNSVLPPVSPNEFLKEGWINCLSECYSMLSESALVLSDLTTNFIIDAFLSTFRGCEFIYELIEIYVICKRIYLSASIHNVTDPQIQKSFNQIDNLWKDLSKFIKKQEHIEMLNSSLTQSLKVTSPAVDALSVEPNCGVCVTPVSLSGELDPRSAVISLAGRVYHASCANLWVNRIELSLPSHRAPSSYH